MNNFMPKPGLKQAFLVVEDKVYYRRRRITQLRLIGYSNKKIADNLGYSLSTIEKDLYVIRKKINRNTISLSERNFLEV